MPLILLMFAGGMLGAGALGIVVERFAYRPLRNAPRIAPLISALGVSFFLANSVLLLTHGQRYSYAAYQLGGNPNTGEPGSLFQPAFNVMGRPVTVVQLLVVTTSIALMIALTLVVSRTKLGKAMRAVAFDREAASMMGIDTDRVIMFTFFIASVLAGAAGVMFGLYIGETYYLMGFLAGLKAFTAAVVGGIGSIPGAMVGRAPDRRDRVVRRGLRRRPVVGHRRLRDPDPVHAAAADRACSGRKRSRRSSEMTDETPLAARPAR